MKWFPNFAASLTTPPPEWESGDQTSGGLGTEILQAGTAELGSCPAPSHWNLEAGNAVVGQGSEWRKAMADDKSKIKEDRKRVASDETYEVADFARKYGVAPSEAKTIIKRYGPSRKKLDAHMARQVS